MGTRIIIQEKLMFIISSQKEKTQGVEKQ